MLRAALRLGGRPPSSLSSRASVAAAARAGMAQEKPVAPADVLAFWFGAEGLSRRELLSTQEYCDKQMKLWYGGGAAVDAQCAEFASFIRAAGAPGSTVLEAPEWATQDGRLAAVVLFDQLTRGAFRGSAEAYAYDALARDVARAALAAGAEERSQYAELLFILSPLLHSEALADLEAVEAAQRRASARWPGLPLAAGGLAYAVEHAAVVRRFGRYPHRNAALGRASTPEELAWLADKDALPGWAKSQL